MPVFLKSLGIGLLIVIISLFMVQKDLRLRIWGVETEATVSDAWMASSGKFGTRKNLKVEYVFRDPQDQRVTGEFSPGNDWLPPADLKVKVTYLPYKPGVNRLSSQSGTGGYILLLFGLGLSGYGVYRFFTESVVASHRTAEPINPYGKVGKALDKITGK